MPSANSRSNFVTDSSLYIKYEGTKVDTGLVFNTDKWHTVGISFNEETARSDFEEISPVVCPLRATNSNAKRLICLCLRSPKKDLCKTQRPWNGAPKRIRSEQSERNSDCYTKCQSRLRQQSTLRVVRIRTAKFVNFAVLLPMSAARDKLKCYALDLSLLAVTEKKDLCKTQRSWNGAPKRIRTANRQNRNLMRYPVAPWVLTELYYNFF